MSALDIAALTLPAKLFQNCNVVLFEDDSSEVDLYPLTVLRPSWEIFFGLGCLRKWVQESLMDDFSMTLRPRTEMTAISTLFAGSAELGPNREADVLFLNGRVMGIWSETPVVADEIPESACDTASRVIWARCSSKQARSLLKLEGTSLAQALVQETDPVPVPKGTWTVLTAQYMWDYMRHNSRVLERQLNGAPKGASEWLGSHVTRELPSGVQVTDKVNGHPVYVGSGSRVMPGVVFGNGHGPIWIGAGVEIEPNSYVQGPIVVGPNCRVKAGARLYSGSSLGVHSRVAGEVAQSIMQGFVNKQHDGFLGNSHLGSWVNLGADTRTSNLRNDYSPVKVRVGDRRVDSGERFIGLMCGDHTKTGINTMFNTATVVGIGANVYGAGYPPQFIESFQWGGKDGLKLGDLQRTLQVARYAMSRRGVSLSTEEEALITRHYREVTERGTNQT